MIATLIGRAVRTVVQWTASGVLVGLALGFWAMFEGVSPFAEPGSTSPSFSRYADWVPLLAGGGALAGLAFGVAAAYVGTWWRLVKERRASRQVLK